MDSKVMAGKEKVSRQEPRVQQTTTWAQQPTHVRSRQQSDSTKYAKLEMPCKSDVVGKPGVEQDKNMQRSASRKI